MAAGINERYALFLLHLTASIMREQVSGLAKFGIPPAGVGRTAPLGKDLQAKVAALFSKIDEVIKEATVRIIEESASEGEYKSETGQWLRAMLGELKTRVSSLEAAYEADMKMAKAVIEETEALLAE
jgi:hypothetical protein